MIKFKEMLLEVKELEAKDVMMSYEKTLYEQFGGRLHIWQNDNQSNASASISCSLSQARKIAKILNSTLKVQK